MPKNREDEKPVESHSESGEEEGEDGSSDSQVSESESEPELTPVSKKSSASTGLAFKKLQPHSVAEAPQQAASSSEEEDSGSDSESESDGPPTQKSGIGAIKPRSKPNAPEPVTPGKSTLSKQNVGEKDAKKANRKLETLEKKSNDDSKKLLFQRLWSEDDEIVILKGMIEYASKKKTDPVADLNAFHDFIKKNLHVDVTRTQLQDKIRRLKKKHENNKIKEKEGKGRTLKAHEQKAYELSKSIWGNEAGKENGGERWLGSPKASSSAVRKAVNKKTANAADHEEDKGKTVNKTTAADNEEDKGSKSMAVVSGEGEKSSLGKRVSSVGGLSVEDMIMAAGSELFEAGKGLEGERQWKKLRVEMIEAHLRQLEVKTAQTRLVLDVLKSAEH